MKNQEKHVGEERMERNDTRKGLIGEKDERKG